MDSNDGTFLMCFKDWRSIYHNLYACVDFKDAWFGTRFEGAWTKDNSGGVPTSGTNQESIRWAKNPQYTVELRKPTNAFISLSQEDGRDVKGSVFPFEGAINTACFTIMRAGPQEKLATGFDQKNIVKLSVLKLHRNLELRITLPAGKYFIVPATMEAGKTGEFWISVYLECEKSDATLYDCRNPEDKGRIIAEEEEDLGPASQEEVDQYQNLLKFLSSL